MNLYLKYNFEKTCRVILQEQLDKFNFKHVISDNGCIHFSEPIPTSDYLKFHGELSRYGIEIIDNRKAIIVQKIKTIIITMLDTYNIPLIKISTYLSEELKESYRTIAQIFSEVCYMSIENFIIVHKIEKVKQLMTVENLSITEISYKLNYSSVAHLSNQFKKNTGFTPTTFQRIAAHKRSLKASSLN